MDFYGFIYYIIYDICVFCFVDSMMCIWICVFMFLYIWICIWIDTVCILRVWFLMFLGWELPRCLEDSESYHKGPGD